MKKNNRESTKLVTVFSDASLRESEMGCGWWFKGEGQTGTGSNSAEKPGVTIQETELWGIVNALQEVSRLYLTKVTVVVQCDNLAALQALLSIGARWAKTSPIIASKRKYKSYSTYERELLEEVKSLYNVGPIYLKHVKGHTGKTDSRSYVNKITDRLASKARRSLTSN